MLIEKGRVVMLTRMQPADRRLWLVSLALNRPRLVAVGYLLAGPTHSGSPIIVRLAAAAIVTACAAIAKMVAGPRATAVTGVVGVLITVVVLTRLA